MRRVAIASVALMIAVSTLPPAPALAAAPDRCQWTPRSIAAAPKTDEAELADWIVSRILKLAADSAPVVDLSPREAAAATGVDVSRVDADAVVQQVRERLRELSRQPMRGQAASDTSETVAPPACTPSTSPAGLPETRN